MRPNLRQIESFLAVAATGNFSRAAERIGSSQPATSQAVRELETALGTRLLDRTTRRVEPTAAGIAFRDQATKGLEEIDRGIAEVRDRAGLRVGHLRIAAPPMLAATALPPAIASFAARHSGLTFALSDVGTEEIVARVRAGRVDLGIGTFPPGDPDLDRRPVLRDSLMLFLAPDHPLAAPANAPIAWAALAGRALITLTRDSGLRLLAEMAFERAGLGLRPAHEVTQIATALALAAAGMGAAILPGHARALPAGTGLVARPLVAPAMSREVTLLLARDRSPAPATLAFAEHLSRALRASAPA